jgi:putative ABC transport system permease protein
VILGLCLALTKVFYDYGWTSLGFIPWSLLGVSVLLSLVCGTGLAVGGALYPAYVAAKMEPAVAMRVDQ